MSNHQVKTWESEFGKEYTNRNTLSQEELDKFYIQRYGISKTEMNTNFLNGLNLLDKKILEVGCNSGNQLRLLDKMGYTNLYGVEVQEYAVNLAKQQLKNAAIVQGDGKKLPFENDMFEMVFTCGVLIHISPDDIGNILDEIYRCSAKYIWGLEYFADQYTEVNYRGNSSLLWKTDFAKLYLDRFPDLELVKSEKYKYLDDSGNIDSMFLLKKRDK